MIDIEVILRAQKGDKQAFRRIFSTYRQKVYRTAYLILKDYGNAEDVVQETFLQVFLKLFKLSDPYAFERWLYRITVNLCFEFFRKQGKTEVVLLDENIDREINSDPIHFNEPEEAAIKNDTREKILKIIQSLPPRQSIVLILFYYNEFSVREIAEIVNVAEGTVKSRLYHGRKTLEEVLSRQELGAENKDTGGVLYGNR